MKKILLSIAALSLMLASCSSGDKAKVEHNNLYYFTDYETYLGFGRSVNIQKGEAFSGKCYSKADSSLAFSAGFYMNLGDISAKKLKKVEVTSQMWLSGPECEASLVITIQRGDSTVKWEGFPLKEKIKEFKTWGEMKVSIPLPQNLESYDVMKVYLWNTSNKGVAKIDDLAIQFYE
jgi:hypothetical protein